MRVDPSICGVPSGGITSSGSKTVVHKRQLSAGVSQNWASVDNHQFLMSSHIRSITFTVTPLENINERHMN